MTSPAINQALIVILGREQAPTIGSSQKFLLVDGTAPKSQQPQAQYLTDKFSEGYRAIGKVCHDFREPLSNSQSPEDLPSCP